VAAVGFDAIGPAIVIQGQVCKDARDCRSKDADESEEMTLGESALHLALPQDASNASRLLSNVSLVASSANVNTRSLPSIVENCVLCASLSALRHGDARAIGVLSDGLFRRGFCWIDVDDVLAPLGEAALQEASTFLQAATVAKAPLITERVPPCDSDVETRASTETDTSNIDESLIERLPRKASKGDDDLSDLHLVGHFVDQWKSGVRLLSGDLVNEPTQHQGLPPSLSTELRTLSQELDTAATDVLKHALHVFGDSESAVSICTAKGISLLYDSDLGRNESEQRVRQDKAAEDSDSSETSTTCIGVQYPKYGIVDCVRYSMAPGCPEIVVGAHIDPGLFVLALPQNGQGLQLRDEHGKWVDVPDGKGVIWAGAAAMSRVKGGEHRVLCRAACGVPRMALWHELCTYGQLVPPMLDLLEKSGLELRMDGVRGTYAVMRKLRAMEDHQPDAGESHRRGQESVAQGQGAIAIKGISSPKLGWYGWEQLIGPEAIARTSGSWSGSGGLGSDDLPSGTVEVVPKGYNLHWPDRMRGNQAVNYGTRKYLKPENMTPVNVQKLYVNNDRRHAKCHNNRCCTMS